MTQQQQQERDELTIGAVAVAMMAIISEQKDKAQMMPKVKKALEALKQMV